MVLEKWQLGNHIYKVLHSFILINLNYNLVGFDFNSDECTLETQLLHNKS